MAYANTCTSSSCEAACYYTHNSCSSWSTTYGMCDQTDQQHDWVSRTSAIVGIVIGVLAGITVLVIIIVIMMISCKRKRTSMWTVQTLPPSIDRRIAQKSSLSVHYQSILSPVLSDRA